MLGREEFDRDLGQLEAQVVLLSALVESAVLTSLLALKGRDDQLARQVIADDDFIDDKRHDIEESCAALLRREAPVARDLRRAPPRHSRRSCQRRGNDLGFPDPGP